MHNPTNNVHPKIKTHLVDGVFKCIKPTILQNICKFSNTLVTALFPEPKRCALYMMGMCHRKNCDRIHKQANDEEAEHILTLLEKAVKNPKDIKETKGK
eukprot:64697-Ditylum_brightwellii.AAC.1